MIIKIKFAATRAAVQINLRLNFYLTFSSIAVCELRQFCTRLEILKIQKIAKVKLLHLRRSREYPASPCLGILSIYADASASNALCCMAYRI